MKKKVIRTTITLLEDIFDESGSNVLIAEGLRTSAMIRFGGGAIMPMAEVVIYGLSFQVMRKLTRIRWRDMSSMMNQVRIEAGEQNEDLLTVFEGNITDAIIDTMQAPEIGLRISGMAGIREAYSPVSPTSYPGEKSVVSAIREIAASMGYSFENSGVPESLTMRDVTLVETSLNKIRRLCASYQIDLYVENYLIAIAPQGAPRAIYMSVVSPSNGLIGYPTPTIRGVDFRCLWTPEIRYGGLVRIKDSLIETVNGDWRVFGVMSHLETERPNGQWFSHVMATFKDPNNAAISRK